MSTYVDTLGSFGNIECSFREENKVLLYPVIGRIDCFTLFYTVLHCFTLFYTVLHCLHCFTLFYTVLHCVTLCYTVLHCVTLFYTGITVLHCFTLFTLFYTVLLLLTKSLNKNRDYYFHTRHVRCATEGLLHSECIVYHPVF